MTRFSLERVRTLLGSRPRLQRNPRPEPLWRRLFPKESWKLIYWDTRVLLFGSREDPAPEIRWADPLEYDRVLRRVSSGEVDDSAVRGEIDRLKKMAGENLLLRRMETLLTPP